MRGMKEEKKSEIREIQMSGIIHVRMSEIDGTIVKKCGHIRPH